MPDPASKAGPNAGPGDGPDAGSGAKHGTTQRSAADDLARFAPSPSGYLHLGHAYAAAVAWGQGAPCLIRIEDIDRDRCLPAFEAALLDDLAWLGFESTGPVLRQSDRLDAHADALHHLRRKGLTYPCFCSRREIRTRLSAASPTTADAEAPEGDTIDPLSAPQADDNLGPTTSADVRRALTVPYDGTCRALPESVRRQRMADAPFLWRLDVRACLAHIGGAAGDSFGFDDILLGRIELPRNDLARAVGDFAISRRDVETSYHLAVVVDDAWQGVTIAPRGKDLAPVTFCHLLLQGALGLPTPRYAHHPLVVDSNGRRMAKRAESAEIRAFRQRGLTPADVLALARRSLAP